MFRRSKLAILNTKDDRIKIINERINLTEKHLIEMCSSFAACTRKLAKYRDSYDELSKCFKNYTDEEEINESFSDGMKNVTNAVTILADYMDLNVHRMEIKIVNELAQFDNLCKTTRDNLRTAVIARDKEVLKQRQMLELKTKFSANNSAADSELLKAKMEVSRTNKEIDEIIFNFEKHKLNDIKTILVDFILISMKYHTKSLEVLSSSYYDVSNIDERGDFSEFQKLMKSKTVTQEKKSSKKTPSLRSQSMESLDRDQILSPLKRKSRISKSTKNLSESKTDEDDEDDDGEEEEEEDDDDEDDDEDPSDTSKSETDSVTEAEDVGEAFGLDNESDSKTNHLNLKKPLRKPQVKHPFKAVAATHVLKKSSKRDKNAFVTKHLSSSNTTGIPRLVTGKREENKSARDSKGGIVGLTTTHGSSGVGTRRLVTVVESKKKSSGEENEVENVIDCTQIVGEAFGLDNESDSKTNHLNLKKPLRKPQVKHPFKAVAATHVLKKSSKRDKNAFVTKHLSSSNTTGIPRLVTGKREENKSARDSKGGIVGLTTTHGSSGVGTRRLVTVVESKKKSSGEENEVENVIDCTRNFRN